ncbi:MAG: hypothetical protein A3C55_05480 [Gammaproteobacteria bacterium RIFCSPHIGHO2_02_FULL_42_13]|nr:MAG: hypothetical protein A3C55_05480 [Gammaproteobacteria bacterium RIFCSPHIGHO2_02_FULL_42_13]OGT69556.1 MAG: hypothetical protein A3H43_01205 [Gammaproteobacteria bacterium RIFCSPLOWO2_02_FULL_42_9]
MFKSKLLKTISIAILTASSTFMVASTYAEGCSAVDFQGCVDQVLKPLDKIQKTLTTNGSLYELLQNNFTSTNSKLDTSNTSLTAIKGLLTFSDTKPSALIQIYDQLNQIYQALVATTASTNLASSTGYYRDYLDDTAGAPGTKDANGNIIIPPGNPYLLDTDLTTPIATGIEVQAMSARNQLTEELYNYIAYGQFKDSQSIKTAIFKDTNNLPDLTANYINLINAESPVYGPLSDSQAKTATPPASAKDLLGTQIYAHGKNATTIDSNLDNRLQAYIKNLSASGFALPAVNTAKPTSQQAQYIVLQRTLSAIQSVADYNIAEAYAERLPEKSSDSPNPSSATSLLQFMDTHNPGSKAFWDSFFGNNTNLFTRVHMMLVSFFGINYNLYKISQELEQIKLELAGIMTQNTITLSTNVIQPISLSAQPTINRPTPTPNPNQ